MEKSKKALIKHTLDKEYFQSLLLICTPLRKLIYYTSSNIIQWFGQDIPPKIFLVETENCLKSVFATSCTLIEFNLHELHGPYSFGWKYFRCNNFIEILLIVDKVYSNYYHIQEYYVLDVSLFLKDRNSR